MLAFFELLGEGQVRTIYVGGEHEVRCDGNYHWVCPVDAPRWIKGLCDCHPTFTKQHYEAIAACIRANVKEKNNYLVYALANMFEADNPLFDRKRFWDACFKEQAPGAELPADDKEAMAQQEAACGD